MLINISGNRCFVTPFTKGNDIKSKTDQEGIGAYGSWHGWFLSWFGYAVEIKDDQNHIFYVNRKSAIYWIRHHGETFDETKDSIQVKIKSVAEKELKKAEKKSVQPKTDPVEKKQTEIKPVKISWEDLYVDEGKSLVIPGRGDFPKNMLFDLKHAKEKPTLDSLNTPRSINLADRTIAVDGIIIEALCINSENFKQLCKASGTLDFSNVPYQEWAECIDSLDKAYREKKLDTQRQCNWLSLKILISSTHDENVSIPGRTGPGKDGVFPKKVLQKLVDQKEKLLWNDLKTVSIHLSGGVFVDYIDCLIVDALTLNPDAFKLDDSLKQIWKDVFCREKIDQLKLGFPIKRHAWLAFKDFFYKEIDTAQINWLCISILTENAIGDDVDVVNIPGRGTFPKKMLERLLSQKEKLDWEALKTPRTIKLSDKTISVDGLIVEALCIDSSQFNLLWKGRFSENDLKKATDLSADFSEKTWTEFLKAAYQNESELNDIEAFLLADKYTLQTLKNAQQNKLNDLIKNLPIDLESFEKVETLYNYIQPIERCSVLKKSCEDYFEGVFVEGSIDHITKIYNREKEEGSIDLIPFMLKGLGETFNAGQVPKENLLEFHDYIFANFEAKDRLKYLEMLAVDVKSEIFNDFTNSLSDKQLTLIVKEIFSNSKEPLNLLGMLALKTSQKHLMIDAASPMLESATVGQLLLLHKRTNCLYRLPFHQLAKVVQQFKNSEKVYLKFFEENGFSNFLKKLEKISFKELFASYALDLEGKIKILKTLTSENITLEEIAKHLNSSIGEALRTLIDIQSRCLEQEGLKDIAKNLGLSEEESKVLTSRNFYAMFGHGLAKCQDEKSLNEFSSLLAQHSDTLIDDLIDRVSEKWRPQNSPILCAEFSAFKAWQKLKSGDSKGLSEIIKTFSVSPSEDLSKDERTIYASSLARFCQAEHAGIILDSFGGNQRLGKAFLQTILKSRDLKKIQNAFNTFWKGWYINTEHRYGLSSFEESGAGCANTLLPLINTEEILRAVWMAVPKDLDDAIKSKIRMFLITKQSYNNFGSDEAYEINIDEDTKAKFFGLEVYNKDASKDEREKKRQDFTFEKIGDTAYWVPKKV